MGIAGRILKIEHSAEAAWPALREEALEGWRLRFADGFTRRSNSVQPFPSEGEDGIGAIDGHPSGGGLKAGNEALVMRIAACEAAYHAVKQPAIFRISPLIGNHGLADDGIPGLHDGSITQIPSQPGNGPNPSPPAG